MSDNTILPERNYLEIHVPIYELCISHSPTDYVYRMVFRVSILNISRLNLRLLGRKWMMRDVNGNTFIIEGNRVFNQVPMLAPGAVFSYGGYHDFAAPPASMEVRFFGVDQMLTPFISTPGIFPARCFRLPRKR